MPTGDAYSAHERVTVIEPPAGWRLLNWREMWGYRELLWVLATRDVKVRYKQTVLGAAWAILRPLLTMAIFTVIFGRLAKVPSDGYPYSIFVYAGLLPWTFFASAVSASGQSLVGSAPLVSKVYFPRLFIPLSSIGSGLADLLVSTAILLVMMVWYHVGWTPRLAATIPLLALLIVIALAVGTLLSAATVAYRDFTHITPFIVQIWMYATPVVFPLSLVPQRWRWVMYLNPMTGVIEGFRSAFLGRPFDWVALGSSTSAAIVLMAAGASYFGRVERRFADII
jgi:lipopolysaccharide transport system permease protein